MNLHKIKQLFPSAKLQAVPTQDPLIVSIPFGDKFIEIKKNDLSEREQLLFSFTQTDSNESQLKQHLWYPILFEHQSVKASGSFRILQVKFNDSHGLLKKEWLTEIRQMLPFAVDSFFINESTVLIAEQQKENLTAPELEGLFVALDMDFDCYTHLFVGAFHHSSHDFTALLAEEMFVFQQEITRSTSQKCFTLSQALLHLYGQSRLLKSPLLPALYQDWFVEEETADIIRCLWKNQGNASSTAKDLFMHRNTLLYKIDKFQEISLLNLKEMDDLLLCYLIVSHCAD